MLFPWRKWLRRAETDVTREARRGRLGPVSRFRPGLVGLEERLTPATILVDGLVDNNEADAGLSLREAVLLVNNAGDAVAALGRDLTPAEQGQITGTFGSKDVVFFASALLSHTITLTNGGLLLAKDLRVAGPGADRLTVSGNHTSRVFEVTAGTTVAIDGLTIADGKSDDFGGGGICNDSGTLTVRDCVLTGNSALFGGGIYNHGTLNVSGSNLSGNSARIDGGGIENTGTLTISDSTLSGNSADIGHHGGGDGGGIISFGTLSVNHCSLADNSASHDGGGILNWQGQLAVSGSTLENNSAGRLGGGIYDLGFGAPAGDINATVTGCTLIGNSAINGGGICNQDGTLDVTDSTLSGNSAPFGGGIENAGQVWISGDTIMASSTLTISNSTFSGNSADFPDGGFGGGIFNFGALTVADSSLTDNSAGTDGGGIYNPLGTLTISRSTLGGNSAGNNGGSIFNQATLSLSDCTLDSNSASNGGGIYNAIDVFPDGTIIFFASVDISSSTLTGNTASFGGGIYNYASRLTISDSTLDSNSANYDGGGIDNHVDIDNHGTLEVMNSGLNANSAGRQGGGIENGGTLTISGSTLTGNSATFGGGIDSYNALTVSNCGLVGNSADLGGGICNRSFPFGPDPIDTVSDCYLAENSADAGGGIWNTGTMTVGNSTVSDNSGGQAGGILNSGTLNVSNSTLAGNSCSSAGGGIVNHGTMTVSNSTVSGNSAGRGGGIFVLSGTLTVGNTILAGNTSANSPDLDGAITTNLGHNLIGNTEGGSGFVASDLLNVNPLLAPLGDYGGPTQTMPLLPGSPAVDAGDNALAPATDQRGVARGVNGTTDIGAFESRGFTITITGGNNQQTLVNTNFPAALGVAVGSAFGEPVQGGVVTFTAPAGGAGATYPSGNAATLDAAGRGSVGARANGLVGSYTVSAAARGGAAVAFNLRNVDATTVTLTSSANPSNLGQAVTFTAAVTTNAPGSGTPTGTVTFLDGATLLATVALDAAGHASFTAVSFALTAGSHTITARYDGDSNFLAATSATLTQVVLSVQEQGAALIGKIDALVNGGALSASNASALKSLVNDAMAFFAAGNVTAGVNKMNAFINKVNDFRRSGRLTDAQADDLINAARAVIVAAQGP